MKLQAKDLRVGNLLTFSNGIDPDKIIVVGRRFFSSASIEKEDGNFDVTPYYRSIPLTEDWLRRGGFEYDEYNFMGFVLESNLGISIGKDENGVWFYFGNLEEYWVDILNEIKYVHQLQNLYFALTGEELEFNQTPTTSWDH